MGGEERWKAERHDRGLTLAHYFEQIAEEKHPPDPNEIIVRNTSNIGQGISGLDVIPSSPEFIRIQERIKDIPSKQYGAGSYVTVLQDFIKGLAVDSTGNVYDYILVDCPPSLGALTPNGLFLSDYFLIPSVPDWLSTYGIPLILREARKFSNFHDKFLSCLGIVFCRRRLNLNLHKNTIDRYKTNEGRPVENTSPELRYPKVFETVISERVAAEAAIEPEFDYSTLRQKYMHVYDQYENLTQEFLQTIEVHENARKH